MNTKFLPGFYTALGTPLTNAGTLHTNSFCKQINDQINSGASGLLIMGSMGIQAYIQNSVYPEVARVGADQVKAQCPVMVGVMDTSISRVLDRISSLEGLPIDGVVTTVPFYNTLTQTEVFDFYKALANNSPFPIYMYDLAGVTKTKITTKTACSIRENLPNVRGIKSGDLTLARVMNQSRDINPNFSIIYSGLDTFDIAYQGDITKQLDGMFACTAPLAKKIYSALAVNNAIEASKNLNSILRIRNTFIQLGVFSSFTAAMILLGYEGRYHPDYCTPVEEAGVENIRQTLSQEGLL
ncbi:MAG: dihydrodipicolinate synthase family protein [Bacteroidetes bacterium]|nr:dihydrodipicolinate synthase family protein [Bacteroidota bacterium]